MTKSLRIAIFILFTVFSTSVSGQNNQRVDEKSFHKPAKNEIGLNVINSLLGKLELNYEGLLSESSGLGITTSISLMNREEQTIRSIILPYFRFYFGDGFANGTFIESNMAVAREYYPEFGMGSNSMLYKYQTSFGLGSSVGYKMVRRNGLFGEYSFGVGRLFGNSYSELYYRIGISIGTRW
jgi:hypothetical protein